MVNIFGMDLDGAFDAIKGATSDLFQHLDAGDAGAQFQRLQGAARDPFQGLGYGQDPFGRLGGTGDPFGKLGGTGDPFAGLNYGGGGGGPFGAFEAVSQRVRDRAQQAEAAGRPQTTGSTVNGPSAGMSPGVAKWAAQTQQVFGGLVDPDVMLAIMQNESGGDPNAYNKAGDAWGLFQQLHLGSNDPNVQFQAARKLAEEKIAGINAAYAKNGLNPDARTRALDFALAWAGHFDYGTGRMNPNSVDNLVGGQTSQQFADIFLGNYDKIKAGRQQPGGNVPITPDQYTFPVIGYGGQVQLHHGSETGASDIFAAEGTGVVAMRGGQVLDASWNNLGGNTVTILGDDGLTYYYAHLRDAPLVQAGQRVQTGGGLGYVGQTGNAQGTGAHLHLGIGKTILSGAGALGGSGTSWGSGPTQNAVGLLQAILNAMRPTGGGGANYR